MFTLTACFGERGDEDENAKNNTGGIEKLK